MKILWLANIPSPYRVDFFNELGKYCQLTVVYERKKASDREWTSDKNINYEAIFLSGLKIGNDTALCLNINKYLNKSFDKIIIGGYSTPTGILSIMLLKLKKIPFYLNCDGGFIKKEKKYIFLLKKYLIGSANYWLSSGLETNKYLKYYGANEDKIYIYPFTSVKKQQILKKILSKNDKNKLKEQLNINDSKIIIFVGQIIYRKGIDILLKVASHVDSDVSFYIIGGQPTKEYEELKKLYNLKNVKFINFMDKDLLFKYYKIADIFLFPTREDIWGLVVNEAMANGLPIITSDKCIAGLELVKNSGYIIKGENINEYVTKISKLINDESKLNQLGEQALIDIRPYNITNMAKEIYSILRKERNNG